MIEVALILIALIAHTCDAAREPAANLQEALNEPDAEAGGPAIPPVAVPVDENAAGALNCMLCQEYFESRDMVVVAPPPPCGHALACRNCYEANNQLLALIRNRCPYCRQIVNNIRKNWDETAGVEVPPGLDQNKTILFQVLALMFMSTMSTINDFNEDAHAWKELAIRMSRDIFIGQFLFSFSYMLYISIIGGIRAIAPDVRSLCKSTAFLWVVLALLSVNPITGMLSAGLLAVQLVPGLQQHMRCLCGRLMETQQITFNQNFPQGLWWPIQRIRNTTKEMEILSASTMVLCVASFVPWAVILLSPDIRQRTAALNPVVGGIFFVLTMIFETLLLLVGAQISNFPDFDADFFARIGYTTIFIGQIVSMGVLFDKLLNAGSRVLTLDRIGQSMMIGFFLKNAEPMMGVGAAFVVLFTMNFLPLIASLILNCHIQ